MKAIRIALMTLFAACSMLWAMPALAAALPESSLKVVVLVDGSGSFKSRQAEALERAGTLLDALAARNSRRTEAKNEEISIVAMDSMPEVLWQGTRKALKENAAAWQAKFHSRGQLADCTDVTGAFRLAARLLEGDPRFTAKYIVAFTDMIHEPPTASLSACAKARLEPGADFPWRELQGVSVTLLWAPGSQKLTWTRAAEANGLGGSFKVYTEKESAIADLPDPKLPEVRMTDIERQASQANLFHQIGKIWAWAWQGALGLVATLLLLSGGAIVLRRLRARRGRAGQDAGRQP